MYSPPAPHYLIENSEEETRTNLHDALARLSQNSAKGEVVGVVVNIVEVGVVEDILRFQPYFKIPRPVRANGKVLQQRCIGEETSRVADIGENER
jgi:hypothetical protein